MKVVLKMEFLLNKFPCSLLQGEHSTLFRILIFYLSSHLKAPFKPHLCSLKCTSQSKCLGNSQQHASIKFASTGTLWEGEQDYQFVKARNQCLLTSYLGQWCHPRFNPALQQRIPKSKSVFLL